MINDFGPTSLNTMDGFLTLDEMDKINKHLSGSVWKYGHSSLPDPSYEGSNNKWFDCHLEEVPFFSEYLLERINTVTRHKWECAMVYVNGQLIGQDGGWHTDTGNDDADNIDYFTFMIYLNPVTKSTVNISNGHTEFMIENGILAIEPLENRAVMFNSNIKHRGRAPTIPNFFRQTLVWKLHKKKDT